VKNASELYHIYQGCRALTFALARLSSLFHFIPVGRNLRFCWICSECCNKL